MEDALPVAEIERRVSADDFSFLLPMDQAIAFLPAVQFSEAAQSVCIVKKRLSALAFLKTAFVTFGAVWEGIDREYACFRHL